MDCLILSRVGACKNVQLCRTNGLVRRLFQEIATRTLFEIIQMEPRTLFSDSTAAISLAQNHQVTSRNRQIEIKVHHLEELLKTHVISLNYIPSTQKPADILTKAVPYPSTCQTFSIWNSSDVTRETEGSYETGGECFSSLRFFDFSLSLVPLKCTITNVATYFRKMNVVS